jgi:two-component system NtrC family sensor kinase
VACFLVALGYGLFQFRAMGSSLELINHGYLPLASDAARMESSLVRLEQDLDPDLGIRLAAHRSRAALHHGIVGERVKLARETIATVVPLTDDDEELANLGSLSAQLERIGVLNGELELSTVLWLQAAEEGRTSEARALQPDLVNQRRELQTAISQFATAVDGRVRRLSEQTAEAQRGALLLSGILALVALVAGMLMLALAVIALRPIARMTEQVQRIGAGQYEQQVEVTSRDELGVLAERINAMSAAIRQRDEDLRRRAEAELKQQDRLARAERLAWVGQMLAQITHEVRNPLNAMSLNAELLAEDLEALPLDRRQESLEMLGTVRSEIERLEKITEHYLALARRPAPTMVPTDPVELVRGVARLLEEQLRRDGVELELELAEGELVDLDPDQLRQALLNVVRNAAEAGAERVSIRLHRGEDGLDVVVSDDGPGFPAEDAARAFDPFFTTKAKGSGLGLAITRQILEDHAGTVLLEPTDQGTRLVLRLPL